MLKNYYILPPPPRKSSIAEPTPAAKQPDTKQKQLEVLRNRPAGTSVGSIKHLKEALSRNRQKTSNDNTAGLPRDPFTHEEFIKVWRAYIHLLKSKGNKILSSFLEGQDPRVEGSTIHLTFTGKMMASEIKNNQNAILSYLRKQLNNYALDFSIQVKENPEISRSRSLYTPGEIFSHLYNKNPLVKELKERFSLHIS